MPRFSFCFRSDLYLFYYPFSLRQLLLGNRWGHGWQRKSGYYLAFARRWRVDAHYQRMAGLGTRRAPSVQRFDAVNALVGLQVRAVMAVLNRSSNTHHRAVAT